MDACGEQSMAVWCGPINKLLQLELVENLNAGCDAMRMWPSELDCGEIEESDLIESSFLYITDSRVLVREKGKLWKQYDVLTTSQNQKPKLD